LLSIKSLLLNNIIAVVNVLLLSSCLNSSSEKIAPCEFLSAFSKSTYSKSFNLKSNNGDISFAINESQSKYKIFSKFFYFGIVTNIKTRKTGFKTMINMSNRLSNI